LKHLTATLLGTAFRAGPTDSAASPTMSRLGYADRESYHLSPQGAGLLTAYDTAVDKAHSPQIPPSNTPARGLTLTPMVTNGGAARIAVPICRRSR
jgi:hypothetical protein